MANDKILEGLRVIELGGGIAAPLVGLLLADQGAEVVRFADAAAADPVLDAMLARNKLETTGGTAEALQQLATVADVIIVGPEIAPPFDLEALRTRHNPRLVSCVLTAFPPGDERDRLPPYESLAGTAGFLFNKPIGRPFHHNLAIGSVTAGLYGAIGVLAALVARERLGLGQQVTTSLFEASLSTQVLQILAKSGLPRSFLPLRMVGSPFMRIWECKGAGYVYLHITMPKHNHAMLSVLRRSGYPAEVLEIDHIMSDQTRRDPSQVGSIQEAEALKAIYARVFLSKTAAEWEELLGHDLCCIKVRTAGEWLRDSRAAGMSDACVIDDPILGALESPGPLVQLPAAAATPLPRQRVELGAVQERWRVAAQSAPAPEAPSVGPSSRDGLGAGAPLAGLRVVDLSRIIAGPCAARVLAELGAEVVSIQSEHKLDWALSFHLVFNAGKKSVTLDISDDEGKARLWTLLDELEPDALIHNYRHLELARTIGIGPEAVRERYPAITYVHLNAYGNDGVWSDRPGFEQVVQAVSGIQLEYARGGRPKLLPSPVIDIGCGLLGAFGALLGLYQSRRSGQGALVTTHLTSVAVLLQLRQLAALQRARRPGRELPEQEIVAGIVRALGRSVCVAGPRRDLVAWARALGLAPGADVIDAIGRAMQRRPWVRWQRSLRELGLETRIALLPQPNIKRIADANPTGPSTPMVRRREYPGAPRPLAFVGSPLHLSRTALVDIEPPPRHGEHTVEVLRRIGVELPAGSGRTGYPPEKPLVPWLVSFVRWGYFAWRSGNI